MKKGYRQAYTDGIVTISENITIPTDFGAWNNADGLGKLKAVCKLRYEEKTARQEDLEYAERHEATLNMKIKTPLCKKVKEGMEAVIKFTIYHIYRIDLDNHEKTMYLYLNEVRKADGIEFE